MLSGWDLARFISFNDLVSIERQTIFSLSGNAETASGSGVVSRWLISFANGRAESVLSSAGDPRRKAAATDNTTGTKVMKRNPAKPSFVCSVTAMPIASVPANAKEISAAFPKEDDAEG